VAIDDLLSVERILISSDKSPIYRELIQHLDLTGYRDEIKRLTDRLVMVQLEIEDTEQ
jgi:hypothetical protein